MQRWHFAPISLGLLEEGKRMTTKILVFPVRSWSDGASTSWSCMAEFLAWVWLWKIRCCCVSNEEVATVTRFIWIWIQMNRFFYRNNPWILESLPPRRTLSWRVLSFGGRLAKDSCFWGVRAKDSCTLSNLKRNLFPVVFVQTDCCVKHNQECSSVPSDSLFLKLSLPVWISSLSLVWVSRCSHRAAGSFVVVFSSYVRDNMILYSQLSNWLLKAAHI